MDVRKFKIPAPGEQIRVEIPISEIAIWRNNETLVPYENNRGERGVSASRVKEMVRDFYPQGFGSIYVAHFGDFLMHIDGHHRGDATVEVAADSKKSHLLDFPTTLILCHPNDLVKTYQKVNAMKSHTGAEKITNPDLLLGSYIKKFGDLSGFDVGKHALNLMDCVIAAKDNGEQFYIADVFAARPKTVSLLDSGLDKEDFKISPKLKSKTVEALKAFKMVEQEVIAKSPMTNRGTPRIDSNVRAVLQSPGFVMAFVSDYMSNGTAFKGFSSRNPKLLANTLISKAKPIARYSKTVARRNLKELCDIQLAKTLAGTGKNA